MKVTEPQFVAFLRDQGYRHVILIDGKKYAATIKLMFTTAIVIGDIGDLGYEDRWCYHNEAQAAAALLTWDGRGEPKGWHRHPASGRRRPDGDPAQEYVNR